MARLQRSTVKVSYSINEPPRKWASHGRYLAREGAAKFGERGLGFDAEREDVDLPTTLGRWQEAGDAHVFQVIVSPERGAEIDMGEHARKLVAHMERDLGTELEWAGIVHTNTAHPHAHLAVRGIDERRETLTLEKDYISRGLREVSRELATRELGYRTREEIDHGREASIERKRSMELDRAIGSGAHGRSRSSYLGPLQKMRGLEFLDRMGLGRDLGIGGWDLSKHSARGLGRPHVRESRREREGLAHGREGGEERER